jgi:multidrug efflux pump subunit AcrA (membrane-fusion protein)
MAKNINKKKNRTIVIIIIAVIIALFAYSKIKGDIDKKAEMTKINMNATTVVAVSNMVDSLSGSGLVQSDEIKAIVPKLNSEVIEVKVELGDYVNKGDVLAILDSSDIDKQVSLARSSNSVTYQTGKLSYDQTLDQLKDVIDNGQSANDEIWGNWNSATQAVTAAETVYANLVASGAASEAELATASATVTSAKNAADALGAQLATNNSVRFDAQDTYDQVTGVKPATSIEAKQILLQKQSLNNTSSSLNNNLDMLKEQQAGAVITATMDGTITSVGLTVGQVPTGIAFTIQDLNNLSITAAIKERDLADVYEGMKVQITSNSIDEVTYHGEIENIAPTGSMSATGDTTFTTKIMFSDEDNQVKPGMNVKVKYIIFDRTDVIQVPYDSVYTQDDSDYVLVLSELSNGKYKLVPTMVTKEGANDINVEITGVEINDRVLNYPENYLDSLDVEYELIEGMINE